MSYCYDLHVHSREVSPCGWLTIGEMIQRYKERGVSGLLPYQPFPPRIFHKNRTAILEGEGRKFSDAMEKRKGFVQG